ncbi:MAG: Undecaprenyl-phosphate mannosyltransferase [Candidatus Hydrogenedentes bacterium ADurb.Bin101]|jgi:glycosyltransferase involved in cell wall biosynthesis|nr:MAG: Undecaprenyl-phosphate mannosyltransferase [Candidatus Hydrogenedentes bacterium ADurb.Bin101]HOC69326.1 glycosyltransferase family 2 protein [Candidatus Hydrogenedentota bacterium]
MKLIIQIPCFNEEATIGITLDALPREIEGIDLIEFLIVDDGSTDKTVEVARAHGAHYVVTVRRNRGLAKAFMCGLDACIQHGADIIVNTDADNQYNADDIEALVKPILRGEAEIVVGARPIANIEHWSLTKKLLQKIGSKVVRMASGTQIADAPSGFRAMSREAAVRINVFDNYTYTLETIIQAGRKNIPIISVPIRTNRDLRPSRLIHSIPEYVRRSLFTVTRIFMTYRPFRFFAIPGIILFFVGALPTIRFLYFFYMGEGRGHIQSLLFSVLMLGGGVALMVTGLIADLIGVNRQLLEDIRARVRELEYLQALRDKKEK